MTAAMLVPMARAMRGEAALMRLRDWTHRFGRELCPPGADTYGEGVRDSKQKVEALLDGPSKSDWEIDRESLRQTREVPR